MSTRRLASIAFLLLSACAGWDSSTPAYAQPPVANPTPSHHAPLAPVVVTSQPSVEPEPPEPEAPPVIEKGDMVAIASVMLLDDCPEPPAAPSAAPGAASRSGETAESRSPQKGPVRDNSSRCSQSTVQIAVRSDRPGTFRIHAIRVLDATSERVAGTTTLRQPSRWNDADGTYTPQWDERVVPGPALQIIYKLGPLDLSKANKRGTPTVDIFHGPFMLELDVSIDGRRRKVRSSEFGREDEHMMVT